MDSKLRELIQKRIDFLEEHQHTLVIDADTHLTDIDHIPDALREKYQRADNYYQGRPLSLGDILTEMKWAKVDMSLIWQNPATTSYTEDKKANYTNLLQANEDIYKAGLQHPFKFIPSGWVDPKALELEDSKTLARICVREFGFPFVKMNPAQNAYPIDSPEVFEMVRTITDLGAIPAFHFGADTPYTPLEGLLKVADTIPGKPVLGVHMGGGGAGYMEAEETYTKTREAGLLNPYLKFVHSAKRDTHMESDFIAYTLAGAPFSNNIMCASDAPYGRMSWNYAGFRAMFDTLQDAAHPDKRLRAYPGLITDRHVQNYLGGNMALLAKEAYRSILKTNA